MRTGITHHKIVEGDARDLSFLETESIHLVCTSPPYGPLKTYPDHVGQLGNIPVYDEFLDDLDRVWRECFRVLVPGGRVACVVGDVCISRKRGGRHHVLPLSADIQVRSRKLGFDCLTPIRWLKVSNIKLEASRSSRFLGKPNLPNGIVKNDLEHILFLRKPGGVPKADSGTRTAVSDRNGRLHKVVRSGVGRRQWPASPRASGAVSGRDPEPVDPYVQFRWRYGRRSLRWDGHHGRRRHADGPTLRAR